MSSSKPVTAKTSTCAYKRCVFRQIKLKRILIKHKSSDNVEYQHLKKDNKYLNKCLIFSLDESVYFKN